MLVFDQFFVHGLVRQYIVIM